MLAVKDYVRGKGSVHDEVKLSNVYGMHLQLCRALGNKSAGSLTTFKKNQTTIDFFVLSTPRMLHILEKLYLNTL